MIDFFVAWAEQIIIALIIIVLIEMILPNSSNKKYVKVILGIFIIYIVLSPIISEKSSDLVDLLMNDVSIDNSVNLTISQNEVDIINGTFDETYKMNMVGTIENSLEVKGYNILVEDIEIDNNEILSLRIKLLDKSNSLNNNNSNKENSNLDINRVEIEKIDISDNNTINSKNTFRNENETYEENNINNNDTENSEIIKYISETFNIEKENITIVRD